jgi:hypothetical protein
MIIPSAICTASNDPTSFAKFAKSFIINPPYAVSGFPHPWALPQRAGTYPLVGSFATATNAR